MRLTLPFSSYQHRAPQVASRRLVNGYVEQVPVGGKSPIALLRAPGVASWVTLPTGPVRGLCVHDAMLYAVAGKRLYRVEPGGAYTDLGEITGTARVSMASNGAQLVIVAEPSGYVYTSASDTLAEITDADFLAYGASAVAVLDGFAIFVRRGLSDFFHSDYLAATTYDGLNFAVAGGAPDRLVTLICDHRQLLLFGTDSTELWYNTGAGSGSPFAREQNGFLEVGCAAAASPAKADNTVFWLSDKRAAVRLSDLVPVRISTHALEQQWQGYDRVDDAFSFAFAHEGHTFWALTFPHEDATFVYDIATGEWAERRSRVATGGDTCWRANAHAAVYGANVVGDSRSGRLGKLRADCYTEFDEMLRMEWTYPNVYAEDRRAFHRRLQIDVQAGNGLVDGQGSNPQIMLYVSDDGGLTFDAVPNRTSGALGAYRTRSTWNRLGVSTDRVYRAAVSDPVGVAVWNTTLEVEGGRL